MKILVTGTAGFIGYYLAKELLKRGDEVVGLDNINDNYDVNLKYGRLNKLGIYEPVFEEDEFFHSKVIKDLEEFKKISDIIVANRLENILDDVYTRNIFNSDS